MILLLPIMTLVSGIVSYFPFPHNSNVMSGQSNPRGGNLTYRNPTSGGRAQIRVKRTNFAANAIAGPYGSGTAVLLNAVFDPSGTLGSAGLYGGSGLGQRLPGWPALAGLFDEFKVHSITVGFRLITQSSASYGAPFAYGCQIRVANYWDLASYSSITMGSYEQIPNKEFIFTPEEPGFSFRIIPKVYLEAESGSLSSGAQLVSTSGRWFNCSDPPYIVGSIAEVLNVPNGYVLVCDVTYDISFRSILGV